MSTQTKATAAPQPDTPEAFIAQLAFSALVTQALYVVAKLGIADLLADKPQPVDKLAADTNTHERSLYRVLRSLSSVGVFQEVEPKVFALTPLSEYLRAGTPNSMRNGAIFMGEEW